VIQDPGWVKSEAGSGMSNPDHISEILTTIFWVKILKCFDADPGAEWKKFGSGINIPDARSVTRRKMRLIEGIL
jgi:hypothetical protein